MLSMLSCKSLRAFCLRHEGVANLFAFLGVAGLLAAVWVVVSFQLPILMWVQANPLFHGLLLGAATVLGSVAIFGMLCLGFSEHTDEHKSCIHAFRGRGSSRPLFPIVHHWVNHLGMNPRWHSRHPPK